MAENVLDYSAILSDAMSPILEDIAANSEAMGEQVSASADAMSVAMDAAAESAQNLAGTVVESATAVDDNTASTQANTDAQVANANAKDANSSSTNKLGQQFSALRGPLLIAGLALAGIGVGALVVGSQYETAMSQVQALTGQTAGQMAQFNTQVLAMGQDLGASPKELANGLYYILSAGTPASQAMGELKIVTEASAASLVDAATDADALTTALNSYGQGANQAEHYQDLLLVSVKDGKQTMNDLANSIGKAASMGSVAGVSFAQVAAAESTMTLTGLTARMASMDLAALMQDLDLKTDGLAKRAKALGISFDEQKFKTMDLYHQLQYLETATGGSGSKLQALINNSPAFQGAVKLMTDKGEYFKNILDDMGHSAGLTASAFKVHEATMGAAFDHLKASGEVALIHVQQALEPIVTSIVAHVLPAVNRFSAWAATHGPELANDIKTVAIAFGITLVAGLGAATVAFIAANAAAVGITLAIVAISTAIALMITHWSAVTAFMHSSNPILIAVKAVLAVLAVYLGIVLVDAAIAGVVALWALVPPALAAAGAFIMAELPLILLAAAVVAVIAVVYELVTHWKQVTAFLGEVWSVVWHAIVGALQAAWSWIQGVFAAIVSTVQSWGADIQAIWSGIVSGVQNFVALLGHIVQAGFQLILAIITAPIRGIVALFSWLFDHNYYFQALVMLIKNIVARDFALVKAIIQGVITDIVNIFHFFQATGSAIWIAVVGFFKTTWAEIQVGTKIAWKLFYELVIQPIINLWHEIVFIWNIVVMLLRATWNTITGDAKSAWLAFVGAITRIVSGVTSAIGNVISAITTPITQLAQTAITWGENLIKGFIQGIGNMAGQVKNAVGNVAHNVASFLGFHSPAREGEGREAAEWPVNFVNMYAAGLLAGVPTIRSAAASLAGATHAGIASAPLALGAGTGAGYGAAAGAGETHLHFHMDNSITLLDPAARRTLVQQIAQDLAAEFSKRGTHQRIMAYGATGALQ